MNSRNSSRSNTAAKRSAHRRAGFTIRQVLILALVAMFGFGGIGLAAAALLAPAQATAPAAATTQTNTAASTATGIPATQPAAQPLPAACLPANSTVIQGSAARVTSSGALEVTINDAVQPVRLAGILLPSSSGSLNEQAAQVAGEMLAGKSILLVREANSQEPGATAGYFVFSGERFLNLELIEQGLAKADASDPTQPCTALFLQAEQQARAQHTGLWQPSPVPTATFLPFVAVDQQAPCDCASRPVCSEFRTHEEAQACFNACADYNTKLDDDHDGLACEELP